MSHLRTDALIRAVSTGRPDSALPDSDLILTPLTVGGYRLISALGRGGAHPFYVGCACLNLSPVAILDLLMDTDTARRLTDAEIEAITRWGVAELRFLAAWQDSERVVTLRREVAGDPWQQPVYELLAPVETELDFKESLQEQGLEPFDSQPA